MWRIQVSDEYVRRAKKFEKKKPSQLNAVQNNLKLLMELLKQGRKIRPHPCGFLAEEPEGVLRISEAGSESKVPATRLYVYPDTDNEVLWLLTVGDKSTQKDDIQTCRRFARQIRADPSLGEEQDDGCEDTEGTEEHNKESA